MAVDLLEQALETVKQGVDRSLIAGEVLPGELLKRGGVSVARDPEFSDLFQTPLYALALGVTVFGNEFRLHLCHRATHPSRTSIVHLWLAPASYQQDRNNKRG
jgi:hypothetical protein